MAKLTKELAQKIIDEMYTHHSLTKVLKMYDVRPKEFYGLKAEIPLLEDQYTRAREAIGDAYADEIVSIADTEPDPHTARNRIDARKWAASKLKPVTYGDRIDLNVNQTVDLRGALEDAQKRLRQVVEITPQLLPTSTGLKTSGDSDTENQDPIEDFEALLK